ncbi:MAG: lytic transglycosylase domain-containing protein [Burkholderiales bacterium]
MGNLRLAGCVVAWSALLAGAGPARAAVWGYIDEQGRPHLATEQLDERYQLFFRGPTTAERAAAAKPPASPADEAFVRTPIFKRLESHPNVKRYEPLIARYAKQYRLDAALVKAVVAVESAFEPLAISPKGAIGLMQVIPDTGARYGLADDARKTIAQKLLDPTTNISIGTRYLRDLLELFANDLNLALAAYNAGEATVARYDNRVPPYPETQEFVSLVTQFYTLYKPPPPPPPTKPERITIPRR